MSRRSSMRWPRVAAVVVALGVATAAHAAPSVAIVVEGREAARVHAAVAAGVPRGWTVAPAKAVARAAKGVQAKKLSARMGAIVERTNVAAVVYARAEARGRVLLMLVRAGEAASERRVARGAVGAAVAEMLQPSVPAATAAAEPVTAPAPAPTLAPTRRAPTTTPVTTTAVEPTVEAPTVVVARVETSPPGALVEVALDGGIGARRLQYNQPLTGNLPSYSVAAVPWLGFRAALFPFARTGVAVLRDLGAFGDFGHSLYQQSVVAGSSARLNATWSSFDVGLRERLRFRRRFSPAVGVALAYGRAAFIFDDHGQLVGDTPSVDYRYLRPALDARVSFGPLTLFVDFGYRALLSAGYVGSHFPHASVGGIDLGAGARVALPRNFVLSLSGQYQRYFYDLRPQPGDPYVAGGALDEFAVGELALAYVY